MNARGSIASRSRKSRALPFRAGYYLFLTAGILGVGYAVYTVVDSQVYQAIEASRLPNMLPTKAPELPTERPEPRVVGEGDVIGEMEIPRLDLKTIVVQGESPKVLRRAVGHLPETALPGKPGNVALAGHRDSFFAAAEYSTRRRDYDQNAGRRVRVSSGIDRDSMAERR